MKFVQRSTVILMLGFLCAGCAHHIDEKSSTRGDNNFNSTLWMQSSSEFIANSLQTYNAAERNLEEAVKTVTVTAAIEQTAPYTSLPPAVIMDIDETVLDNSGYDAKIILEKSSYRSTTWDQWIALQQATAIPGAVDFINHAKKEGVAVILITNRMCKEREGTTDKCPQKSDTIDNLKKVGISDLQPSLVLLGKEQDEWTAEKAGRRELMAEKYRIVMLFGDDLGDFLPNVKKDITPEQRARLVAGYSEKWGSVWYILPNPKYGSWLQVLKEPKSHYLQGY
jgi:5'-nucleotidase (lipoprotein e(P4) family)